MNRLFSQVFHYDYYDGPLSGLAMGADSSELFIFRHLAWDDRLILRVFAVGRLIESKSIKVQAAIDQSSAAEHLVNLYSGTFGKPLEAELAEYIEKEDWETEMYILTNYINDGAICILDSSTIRSKEPAYWVALEEQGMFGPWFDAFLAVCDCESNLLSSLDPWKKEIIFQGKEF